ncbi:MAG: chaperone modulator CbpM [Hyphomicrobiales bacterium]
MTNDIVVYDETTEVTLEQLVTYCHVRREKVVELVREGILAPHGAAPGDWRFGGLSLRRARKAVRLERDLEINLTAVALILDLLDEIDTLRGRTGG